MRQPASQPAADHAHQHGGGAAQSVNPGDTGELVATFAEAGTLQMACLVPGHCEAGMRGCIAVIVAAPGAAQPTPAAMPMGEHRH